MIISLNWIKEYVDLSGIDEDTLVKRFGLSTAEVESVQHKGKDIENVVVAKILTVENHPNSNHLHILTVDDGSGKPVQVVCGAPNVRVGLKTFFARVGANVCGVKIKPAKLAGVESFGMCCGGNELGIEADTTGIIELDDAATIGQSIKDILPVEDVLIEIDNKSLTNRPDLWGHYGIAREFSAIFNRPLKPLNLQDLHQFDNLKSLDIKVETKNCFRYSGITVDYITRKTSDALIKLRLCYCGMREVNFLADLTNYVMLEVGQPMHAFDNDVVKGVVVCENKQPVQMETLEQQVHTVAAGSVLICDENRQPVAVAGVKGGLKSGITDKTKSLFIESACFDCAAIRKSSRSIGLSTDASLRYEKSLDPQLCETATQRMLCLLKQHNPQMQVTSRFTDVYNFKYPTYNLQIDADFISKRGGVKLSETEIMDILSRLGFGVKLENGKINVKVPSFRGTKDISIKEDLVEEIFRMYGYDNIKSSTMAMPLKPVDKIGTHEMEYKIKYALASVFNLNEVHSYVWNYEDFNKSVGMDFSSVVHLMDASKSGQGGLRVNLIPTLLKIASENKNKFNDLKFFEIGRVFDELDENNLVVEKKKLAIVLAGENKSEADQYFALKSIVGYLTEKLLGCKVQFSTGNTGKLFHPFNSCQIVQGDMVFGEMGILHPNIAQKIDKRKTFAVLELDVNKLLGAQKQPSVKLQVSKYQSVSLDFNFVADKDVEYAKLEEVLNNFKCNYIMEYCLKDVFENQQLLPDKKSYTINITITPKMKTLESNEIEKFSKRIILSMQEKGFMLRA